LQEHGTSPDEYYARVSEFIRKGMKNRLALYKVAELITDHSPKYDVGGAFALTDGIRGTSDYHYNWLGFEGNDMVAIVDLEQAQQINNVSVDFLQEPGSWIFLPVQVSFKTSVDGIHFEDAGTSPNPLSAEHAGSARYTFRMPLLSREARYVKVHATSLKKCPDWHIGAGKPCWIFTDEIVVE
jgi:hypothetical protein